jgi:radical SAM protein (TIGR01212 family)
MESMQLYNDFGTWIRKQLPFRVQKITIDAGFTCPNRDGRISTGGCIYCNNASFNPSYCHRHKSVTEQLEEGKAFFSRKYPDMKYLAYFQAFTNTYAPLAHLKALYEEALSVKDVVGLVIGTRPDCVTEELLDYLAELPFILVEYGVESANDETLRRINRGHDFACSRRAIEMTAERGILTGAHIILGLPGEDAEESLRQAPIISSLPIDILKIHQLQVIRGTRLAEMYAKEPFPLYSVDEYIELVARYISLLRKDIVLERFVSQAPADMLIAPRWGLKNHEFTAKLNKYLEELSPNHL